MDIKYSYPGYSLIFLFVWILFHILRPGLRRRMLLFSLIIMPLGPLSEFWFLKDYWRRPTITGYPISVGDGLGNNESSYKLPRNKSVVSLMGRFCLGW